MTGKVLRYIIENESKSFSVKLPVTAAVDDLNNAVKAENSQAFRNIDAKDLTLWKVEIPDEGKILTKSKDEDMVVSEDGSKYLMTPLTPSPRKIKLEFSFNMPDETIRVFVQVPKGQSASTSSSRNKRQAVEEPFLGHKRQAVEERDSPKLPKYTRRFAGADVVFPEFHFYTKPSILDSVGESLLGGESTIVCGYRQSGSSTTCHALLRWFMEHQEHFALISKEKYSCINEKDHDPKSGSYRGYEIHILTLNSSIIVDRGVGKFWETICKTLNRSDPTRFHLEPMEEITGSSQFKRFFSRKSLTNARPVILLIDGASRIVQVDSSNNGIQDVIKDFASVLKALRDDRDTSCMYSTGLFGTENVKSLIAHESPFSYSKCWDCGRFTEDDVKGLLSQFAETQITELDVAGIASDIFELTLGHRGLTGACCSYIEESYRIGNEPIVTVDDWARHTPHDLQEKICGIHTYRLMMQRLPLLSENQRSMFITVMRFGKHQVTPDNADLKFLLEEGLVVETAKGPQQMLAPDGFVEIVCAAPILRAIVMSRCDLAIL
ncbi:ATP-dependent RNA helicase [Mortierella sp. AD011]|nr:ATP-dependent RNA helicase [Mortierella sp. AD010]KAF9400489.1 ATP-dependent RNA helicase [Mortierella sp. AD011]